MALSRGPDSFGIRAKLVKVESRNALVICRGIDCGMERKALFTPYTLCPSDLSHLIFPTGIKN